MLRTLILLALLTMASALRAQEPAVEVSGIGPAPIRLSTQALATLPVAECDVSFETSKGPTTGRFRGVLLLPLILVSAVDGKPLDGSRRFVAPGDKRRARALYEVVKIELR